MRTPTATRWLGFAERSTVGKAKQIIVKPIGAKSAERIVKALHYSGKVAAISQLHFGVFLDGKCGGAMQFGPPIDRRKLLPLVRGTKFNNFLELNRMAFADWLPKNGESRCIAYAMRYIKKHYPHIDWIISFADGTQCGDGTIYRASGFELTQIKRNSTICKLKSGEVAANHGTSKKDFTGAKKLPGFQLRYMYFLNKESRANLTVPVLPSSDIDKYGARMYKGKFNPSVSSETSDTSNCQFEKGGATPTDTHQ